MKNKKILAIALLAALLAAGAIFLLIKNRHTSTASAPASDTTGKVNLNPPTAADKQAVDQHKKDLGNPPSPAPSGQTTISPTIVDAGQYDQQIEVRAFIPGIYEDGGTCSITFSKNNAVITKQVAALKDATTTRCTNLSVPRPEFSNSGTWSVVVTYNSASAQGSSAPKTFEVK